MFNVDSLTIQTDPMKFNTPCRFYITYYVNTTIVVLINSI